ncbi:TOBE domain-containing protein [Paracidovorax konjaci]|uniref:Molybdate transport system regulatory protein n=1 Tax=Paracidovorax konjaci TaxID=32040 RepID=A0A1I1YD50_9BURK|nr:TOBE domain-containing protein [Paracidovorax konjaci]SFE17471.1 molybdate transport system regulatory protein [Paracidovorax konjaci]
MPRTPRPSRPACPPSAPLPESPATPPPIAFSEALAHGPADRRVAVLREIGAGGSISQAARAVGVSYKAAWQAVDTLTNLAGVPLVERAVGGAGGGGARLTAAGAALLQAAQALEQARAGVLASAGHGEGAPPAARLALRTSMRNQWPCIVQALEPLGPVVRVRLLGAGEPEAGDDEKPAAAARASERGLRLAARITRESAELLGLRPGTPVLALCKATAVRVAAATESAARGGPAAAGGDGHASGANAWPGRASRVSRGGAAGDEVSAGLEAGVRMVGFAPPGSGLRAGRRVVLSVDESAVVLAVVEGG